MEEIDKMYIKLITFYYFQGAPATSVHTMRTSIRKKGQNVKKENENKIKTKLKILVKQYKLNSRLR